ncbi:MAG: hypothetical protein DMF63_04515 [Acidobacteria bacterium]|nr:MAG: hypothetical protein DMF63_04515 [Acidobacteriota bacterium]
MDKTKSGMSQQQRSFRPQNFLPALIALFFTFLASAGSPANAQAVSDANVCRIGEKLTYNVKIGSFTNAAYAELQCVSRGRLADRDAIEIRSKFKTLNLASVAFYLIDESRITFASPSTGVPLYTTVTQNEFGLPKETSQSFLISPTPNADMLTMIYRLRQSGGTGSLTMQEGEKVYTFTFQPWFLDKKQTVSNEKQRTDAGEFDTTVVGLKSEYFTERGMTNVRVNLTNDEAHVPVLIRFKTGKGNVRIGLASVQNIEPEVPTLPTTAAVPVKTPVAERTPRPTPTPAPYVEGQPLSSDVAFDLGERLDYRITSLGQQVAMMRLAAKERKLINGMDTLVLEATFSDIRGASPFAAGDYIRAFVRPESLAPMQLDMKFSGELRAYSTSAKFEREGSLITAGATPIESPVGTHSIISLLYAARSFNLKPSRDVNNPINDTRVAVLWESKPHIFTLRPSLPEVLVMDGKQVPAQLISVATKNMALDMLSIKIWLGNDESRMPVRFILGKYQADLVSASNSSR